MEFFAWVGAVFLVLGILGSIDRLISLYGRSWRRSVSGWLSRFRLWRLDRRVSVLTRRYGYRRAPSLGQLRFTRQRWEQLNGPPDSHGDADESR